VCDPFPLRPLPQQAIAKLAFTDAAAKTKCSNLPGQARSGIQLSALSTEQLAAAKAAKAVASVSLSAAGYTDFEVVTILAFPSVHVSIEGAHAGHRFGPLKATLAVHEARCSGGRRARGPHGGVSRGARRP